MHWSMRAIFCVTVLTKIAGFWQCCQKFIFSYANKVCSKPLMNVGKVWGKPMANNLFNMYCLQQVGCKFTLCVFLAIILLTLEENTKLMIKQNVIY